MTDFNKYKNISIKNDTYSKIDRIRKVIVPDDPNVSRAQVVTILVNKEVKKLNGIHVNKKIKVHGSSSKRSRLYISNYEI